MSGAGKGCFPRAEPGAGIGRFFSEGLFLAENKVQQFEACYGLTLEQLVVAGLPLDADYQMHEDFILWEHWADVADRIKQDIHTLG